MTAQFIYPERGNFSFENANQSINIYDTLYVQYQSVFPSLNLTLFCLGGATNSEYYYTNAPTNPLPATGLYAFGTVDEDFGTVLSQYPTACHFKLTDYGNNDDALNGEIFYVTSDSATSTTFQPSATTSSSSSSTSTSLSTSPATTPPANTASATNAPTQTASPHSPGLSTGAKAGIGVGVTLVVLGLLIIVALALSRRRTRRRSHSANNRRSRFPPAISGNPESSATSMAHQSGRSYPTDRRPVGQHEIHGTPQVELYTQPRYTAPHELLG